MEATNYFKTKKKVYNPFKVKSKQRIQIHSLISILGLLVGIFSLVFGIYLYHLSCGKPYVTFIVLGIVIMSTILIRLFKRYIDTTKAYLILYISSSIFILICACISISFYSSINN